jgi:hypothetical protein
MSDEGKDIYKILSDKDWERFDTERKEYKSKLTLQKVTTGSKGPVNEDHDLDGFGQIITEHDKNGKDEICFQKRLGFDGLPSAKSNSV